MIRLAGKFELKLIALCIVCGKSITKILLVQDCEYDEALSFIIILLPGKYKRQKELAVLPNDPEARGPEPATLPAPGVPSQALRGVERPRWAYTQIKTLN